MQDRFFPYYYLLLPAALALGRSSQALWQRLSLLDGSNSRPSVKMWARNLIYCVVAQIHTRTALLPCRAKVQSPLIPANPGIERKINQHPTIDRTDACKPSYLPGYRQWKLRINTLIQFDICANSWGSNETAAKAAHIKDSKCLVYTL